jgi:type IV pilus assembly protein PilB
MDRMTRDCVALVSVEHAESDIENIAQRRFEVGQTPDTILPSVLLTHPQVFVVPDLVDRASLESLLDEVIEEKRTVITRTQANSAAEALYRIWSVAGDRKRFAESVTAVSCQRLLRRLCSHCKLPVAVRPDFVQRIGGDPSKHKELFQVRQPGTVPSVDENGRPIEYIPCSHCRGLGYVGRVAAFELLLVDDNIRRVLQGDATAAAIDQAARKSGHKNLLPMAYQLALAGTTTIAEIQRI